FCSCSPSHRDLHSVPTRRSSDLDVVATMHFASVAVFAQGRRGQGVVGTTHATLGAGFTILLNGHGVLLSILLAFQLRQHCKRVRSEEHTSELQSRENLVCRLLLE